jgi:hypothetical protein
MNRRSEPQYPHALVGLRQSLVRFVVATETLKCAGVCAGRGELLMMQDAELPFPQVHGPALAKCLGFVRARMELVNLSEHIQAE